MDPGYTNKARKYASRAYNMEDAAINLNVDDGTYIYYYFPKFYIVNPTKHTEKTTLGLTAACKYVQEELDENNKNDGFVAATFS